MRHTVDASWLRAPRKLAHLHLPVEGGMTNLVMFRMRVRLARLRNEDEDSVHKLYTLVFNYCNIMLRFLLEL